MAPNLPVAFLVGASSEIWADVSLSIKVGERDSCGREELMAELLYLPSEAREIAEPPAAVADWGKKCQVRSLYPNKWIHSS